MTWFFFLSDRTLRTVLSSARASGGSRSVSAGTQVSSVKSRPASADARVPCESATCSESEKGSRGSADPLKMVSKGSLLTTAVQLPPVKTILLFSAARSITTHTTEEHCTCVKIRSEFKGSCVICGQRSSDLPCAKRTSRLLTLVTERQIKKNIFNWSVKPMVCMNVSPEILLIY